MWKPICSLTFGTSVWKTPEELNWSAFLVGSLWKPELLISACVSSSLASRIKLLSAFFTGQHWVLHHNSGQPCIWSTPHTCMNKQDSKGWHFDNCNHVPLVPWSFPCAISSIHNRIATWFPDRWCTSLATVCTMVQRINGHESLNLPTKNKDSDGSPRSLKKQTAFWSSLKDKSSKSN